MEFSVKKLMPQQCIQKIAMDYMEVSSVNRFESVTDKGIFKSM